MQQSLAKELKIVRCKQSLSPPEITFVNLQVTKPFSGLRNYNLPTLGAREKVVVIEPQSLQREDVRVDRWVNKIFGQLQTVYFVI